MNEEKLNKIVMSHFDRLVYPDGVSPEADWRVEEYNRKLFLSFAKFVAAVVAQDLSLNDLEKMQPITFKEALKETNKMYSGMLQRLADLDKNEKGRKAMDWKTWAQETLEVLRKELGEATKKKLLEAVQAGESITAEYDALRNQIMDYQSDPNYDKQRNIGAELLATALLNDNGSGVMTGVAGKLQEKMRTLISDNAQMRGEIYQIRREIERENEPPNDNGT
jgi:hypothetical protein